MCCLVLLLGFVGPRTALAYMYLINYLSVFQTSLWPLLGFLFMPLTTIAYALALHNGGLNNFWTIVIVIAAIFDLGVTGGSERERRGRSRAS